LTAKALLLGQTVRLVNVGRGRQCRYDNSEGPLPQTYVRRHCICRHYRLHASSQLVAVTSSTAALLSALSPRSRQPLQSIPPQHRRSVTHFTARDNIGFISYSKSQHHKRQSTSSRTRHSNSCKTVDLYMSSYYHPEATYHRVATLPSSERTVH